MQRIMGTGSAEKRKEPEVHLRLVRYVKRIVLPLRCGAFQHGKVWKDNQQRGGKCQP